MSEEVLYDVAIVGFGPVGAVAAALLGQAGLSIYACDRLEGVFEIPRAIALDHEIMRVFQQLQVADKVAQHCEPFTPSEYYGVDGQLIRRMTMLEPPHPQGYTPSLVFTQPPVERILRARVAELPNVVVDLGAELHAVRQDADGASLDLRGPHDSTRQVRAKYLIACDGGSSTVRTLLDMPLEDLDFDEPWLVVDVLCNEKGLAKLPQVSVQYCEPDRPCTLVIGPKNHRRWEISLNPGEDPKQVATDDATWKLLSRWITPEDGTLWRQASYRFHALVAAQWRKGRVFLAGDAAHMQPPFLGQGMCQGMRDAANLSWKLAAVLRGEVQGSKAEDLLDSYAVERRAHVRELTRRIKNVGAVICERDAAKARDRDRELLAACGGVVVDTPRQDILPGLETGLLAAQSHPARGRLFPQPWVIHEGSRKRMDAVAGNGWRLVLAPSTTFVADETLARSSMRVVNLDGKSLRDADGVAAAWFEQHACAAALVRPDNYVYGVAATPDAIRPLLAKWTDAIGEQVTCAA